jgi:hypothetical protein
MATIKHRQRYREPRFTPLALATFAQMKAEQSQDWWLLHSVLRKELRTKPWEWPCIKRPNPDRPSASPRSLAAEKMYCELDKALDQQPLG